MRREQWKSGNRYAVTALAPKPQRLLQVTERGCSVPVFARLARVSEEQLCREVPGAPRGLITLGQWKEWLESRGFDVLEREGTPIDMLPCVHLVAPIFDPRAEFHWVYRDERGDVHDPSPVYTCMGANDPWMRELKAYDWRMLTLSVSRR
jgi:hypothetical protein